jgi:hypothetical protein
MDRLRTNSYDRRVHAVKPEALMRRVQRVLTAILIGCVGLLGAAGVARAKGGTAAPAKGPALEPRLVAAAKALTDTNPVLIGEANLAAKHSPNLSGELIDVPVVCATTVKSSKSGKRAAPMLSATYERAATPSQALLQVAQRATAEAFVGTITIDRELALRARDASRAVQKIPAGTYGVALRAREKEVLVGVEIQGADGTTMGGVAVNGDALARQLVTPAELKLYADFYANAVILNFAVAMLDEDTTPGAIVLSVRATRGGSELLAGKLQSLRFFWTGGSFDIAQRGTVDLGQEKIAASDIVEVRLLWADVPVVAGADKALNPRAPSVTIVTGDGR